VPHLRLPQRSREQQYVASSLQFSLIGLVKPQIAGVIARCAARGLHVKWFGADEPVGFTSAWTHWRYFGEALSLPNAGRVLGALCDLRLPLSLTQAVRLKIAAVIRQAPAD
jgi:hypothetical protein